MFRVPRLNSLPLVLVLLGAPLACLDTIEPGEGVEPLPENDSGRRDLTFAFDPDQSNWTGGYSDFAAGQDPQNIHFILRRDTTPVGTDRQSGAMFVSSTNVSDDLFTFITQQVSRLKPNTPYALTFEVELASNAPRRCPSVNGSPGEDVFLKVGASLVQPAAVTDTNTQQVRLNVDKGNQSVGGENAQTLGDIATDSEQCFNTPYRIITRDNVGNPLRITTDANGRLWLFVGTDSEYFGTTELYYDVIHVVLEPS
ncbi:hypothetical protein [Hyalangium minutum]|uniref:Lipoprotein n=1 Tax=Hyalangium minutum TaxID=394096 RepID=A0A085WK99_9BACT|nr:hypothetical protein [Hyalangium minutum]KFE68112.1 hypothetical protein DB31_7349 [Hyalangium minutum]